MTFSNIKHPHWHYIVQLGSIKTIVYVEGYMPEFTEELYGYMYGWYVEEMGGEDKVASLMEALANAPLMFPRTPKLLSIEF